MGNTGTARLPARPGLSGLLGECLVAEMTYHSSRVCEYCKSEFEGHACPNCGAPYSPPTQYQFGRTTVSGRVRYAYGYTDWRSVYMRMKSDEE